MKPNSFPFRRFGFTNKTPIIVATRRAFFPAIQKSFLEGCVTKFSHDQPIGKIADSNKNVEMRPLTDEEMRVFFEKLQAFLGPNLAKLIDRSDEPHTFRLVKDRVYYISDSQLRLASNIGRENLISLGTCFGKFTKAGKFRLHVTCLDYLAQYARFKVWVKPGAEMSFLYGNNVTKAGLARMTDGIPQYGGVVVLSMSDTPLGFGVAAQPTEYCKDLEPGANVVLHQGDIGEYLRVEDGLF